MSAPIPDATLRALKVCANTPAELERFLIIYEMGYLQSMMDAVAAQRNATQQEMTK